jgi:putative methyltransferase (TIGR04325 family)
MTSLLKAIIGFGRKTLQTAPLRNVRNRIRHQAFLDGQRGHLFWGVYRNYAEAAAAAPPDKPTTYDTSGAASLYRNKLDSMDGSEYAVLYWLEKHLLPGARVFDFGGHVGLKYYAFQTVQPFPPTLLWTVYDLPAIVAEGRKLAAERGAGNLAFTDHAGDASGADIFLALGSLQFLDKPLDEILKPLPQLPKAVIISKTPMVDGAPYYTLHNIGTAFTPYRIESSTQLVESMARLGYQLHQKWKNHEKEAVIWNHLDQSLDHYTSMYFTLA